MCFLYLVAGHLLISNLKCFLFHNVLLLSVKCTTPVPGSHFFCTCLAQYKWRQKAPFPLKKNRSFQRKGLLRIKGPAFLTNEINKITTAWSGGVVVAQRVGGFSQCYSLIYMIITALFIGKLCGISEAVAKHWFKYSVLFFFNCVSPSQVLSPLVHTVHLNKMHVVGLFQTSPQPGKG